MSEIKLTNNPSAVATPEATRVTLYAVGDKLYYKDDTGLETGPLGAGGGGTGGEYWFVDDGVGTRQPGVILTTGSVEITGSLAQGEEIRAWGPYSHAEGYKTYAFNDYSHAEGAQSEAWGPVSHAEGGGTVSNGISSHTEGVGTRAGLFGYDIAGIDLLTVFPNAVYTVSGDHTASFNSRPLVYIGSPSLAGNPGIFQIQAVSLTGGDTKIEVAHFFSDRTFPTGGTIAPYDPAQDASDDIPNDADQLTNAEGSHAEGNKTFALGDYAHSEGLVTFAIGDNSHTEGSSTTALGLYSHAEGLSTFALGEASHAEGTATLAIGDYSHTAGDTTRAGVFAYDLSAGPDELIDPPNAVWEIEKKYGDLTAEFIGGEDIIVSAGAAGPHYVYSYVSSNFVPAIAPEGYTYVTASNNYGMPSYTGNFAISSKKLIPLARAEVRVGGVAASASGNETFALGQKSMSSGEGSLALGDSSHAEGESTIARGDSSHAEGAGAKAVGTNSHAEGFKTTASGASSHSEGNSTTASGNYSHAEGESTESIGESSHAEGFKTNSQGDYSHSEGNDTTAVAEYSHAEGGGTFARGIGSHSEGFITTASGSYSHAEGYQTFASGNYSHAEGRLTFSQGSYSHSEGYFTRATGSYSHAEGLGTIASGTYQHAEGRYNERGNDFSLLVIGVGDDDDDARRNDIVRINSGSDGFHIFEITGSLAVGASAKTTKSVFQQFSGYQYNPTDIKTSPYAVSLYEHVIVYAGTLGATINLPAGAPIGQTYIIKDIGGNAGTNAITVQPAGADQINGSPTYMINTNYGSVTIIYFGSTTTPSQWGTV